MKTSNINLESGTTNKILPLKEAISSYVKPGMSLHIAGGIGGASAAICEIIRQYNGKNPEFELIQSTVTGHAINLLYCNLIKKLIFSACVDLSSSSRPSKVMQKKWAEKSIKFENWSLCSLQQRLMAGALGIAFMPTRSIAGSHMALENRSAFKEITNPFDKTSSVSLLEALNPDLSIVHGWASDEFGNTILSIPYGDDIWGALASREGVLVTVERIVPTEIIRRYAALVKIPGHKVKAVSAAPFGVHPFSLANPGISDVSGYESDVAFLTDLHKAFSDNSQLDAWIKEWVLDCSDQDAYLHKLGRNRLGALQDQIIAGPETGEIPEKATSTGAIPECNPEEMMLIAASREIIQSIIKSQHKIVLLGAGSRSLAVLLAHRQLKAMGYELEVITGNGQYGYEPAPSELGLQSLSGVYSSKMVMDTILSQGVMIGGQNNHCLGVLGAGQIDKYGDTNSTLTSSRQFLVGSGGANDVGNASEVILILNQGKDRFVEFLPYITCPGNRVTTVISNLGVFNKPIGKKELSLTACLPDPRLPDLQARINRVKEECGWILKINDSVIDISPAQPEELKLLREIMPG